MNKLDRVQNGKRVCPKCGIAVSNLRKHNARNRCKQQHIRGWKKQAIRLAKQGKLFF